MKTLKPVTGAMSPKGRSSTLPKVCMTVMGMVMIVFFLSLGGNKGKSDNLRSGQAHHTGAANVQTAPQSSGTPTSSTTGVGQGSSSTSSYNSPAGSSQGDGEGGEWYEEGANVEYEEGMKQEELEETVEVAGSDIKGAENNEVKKEEGMLSQALSAMGSAIESGIKAIMGTDASDEEVKEIAEEVESKLANETSHDFHEKADKITKEELDGLNNVVREDGEEGLDPFDTEADVTKYEKEAIDNVRQGVDTTAEELRQRMRERAAELEKNIMEKRLSQRLGRPVQLQIVEGNLQRMPEQQPQQGAYGAPQQQGYTQQQGYQQPPPPQGGYGYQPPQYQQGGYQQPPQGGYQQQPPPQQQVNYGYQQPPPQQGGYQPATGYGGAAGAPGSSYGAPGGSSGYGSGSTAGGSATGSTTGGSSSGSTTGSTGYGTTGTTGSTTSSTTGYGSSTGTTGTFGAGENSNGSEGNDDNGGDDDNTDTGGGESDDNTDGDDDAA